MPSKLVVPEIPVMPEELANWYESWGDKFRSLFKRFNPENLMHFPCLGERYKVQSDQSRYCWRAISIDDAYNAAFPMVSYRNDTMVNGNGFPSRGFFGLFGPPFAARFHDPDTGWWPQSSRRFYGIDSDGKWIEVFVRTDKWEEFPDREMPVELRVKFLSPLEMVVSADKPIYIAENLLGRLGELIEERLRPLRHADSCREDLKEDFDILQMRSRGTLNTWVTQSLLADHFAPDPRVFPQRRLTADGRLLVNAMYDPSTESICDHCARIYMKMNGRCTYCYNESE